MNPGHLLKNPKSVEKVASYFLKCRKKCKKSPVPVSFLLSAWKTRAFPSLSTFPSFSLPLPSFPLPPSPFPLLRFSLPFCFSPCLPPSPFPHPFSFPFPSLLCFFCIFYLKWLGPGRPGPSPSLSTFPSFSLPLPSFPLPPSPFPRLRFSLPFCFFPSASSFPLSPPFLLSLPFSSLHLLYLLFDGSGLEDQGLPLPFPPVLPSLYLYLPFLYLLPPSPSSDSPFPSASFPLPSSFPLSPPFLLSLLFSSSSLFFCIFYLKWAWKTRAVPFPFHLSFLLFTFTFLSFTSFPLPFSDSPFPSASPLPSSFPLSPPFLLSLPVSSLHFLYLLFEVARAWKTRAFPFPFHLSFLLYTFTFLSFTSFPLPFSDSPFPSASFLLPSSFPLSPPFLLSLPFSCFSVPFFVSSI